MFKYYVALGIAIVTEIIGTMSLKLSRGFTQFSWTFFEHCRFLDHALQSVVCHASGAAECGLWAVVRSWNSFNCST